MRRILILTIAMLMAIVPGSLVSASGHLENIDEIFILWYSNYEAGQLVEHRFSIEIEGEQLNNIDVARFQTPLGNWLYLHFDSEDDLWEFKHQAATMAELQTEYPAGNYTFEFTYPGGHQETTVIPVSASLQQPASVPMITSPAFAQSNMAASGVTVEWEAVASPDFNVVVLWVEDAISHEPIVESEFLAVGTVSHQITGLQPNRVYAGDLIFGQLEDGENSDDVPYMVASVNASSILFGTNTNPSAFDHLEHVHLLNQIDSSGTESIELHFQFDQPLWPEGGSPLFQGVKFRIAGFEQDLYWAFGPTDMDALEWRIDSQTPEGQILLARLDGAHVTVLLQFDSTQGAIATFRMLGPQAHGPLAMPTQHPQWIAPPSDPPQSGPVLFSWEALTDPLANTLYFELQQDWTGNTVEEAFLDLNAVSHGPIGLSNGFHRATLSFAQYFGDLQSDEGVAYSVGKMRSSDRLFHVRNQGDLRVNLQPQSAVDGGAMWRPLGRTQWLQSGATWMGLDAGEVIIEFQDVAGWLNPTDNTAIVNVNELTIHNAAYRMDGAFTVLFATDGTPGAAIGGEATQYVEAGEDCTVVTAIAPDGYRFLKWTLGQNDYAFEPELAIANVTEDMTFTAHFAILTSERVMRYILGLTMDSEGLDLNMDGQVDIADLVSALIAND